MKIKMRNNLYIEDKKLIHVRIFFFNSRINIQETKLKGMGPIKIT